MKNRYSDAPVILFIEDEDELREPWLRFIRQTWSPQSENARSREMANKLLAQQHFDLVIFDRGILLFEGDRADSEMAGDRLYQNLIRLGIDVAVLSGSSLEYVEPYKSHPPRLGFYSKPPTRETFERAVEKFLKKTAKT